MKLQVNKQAIEIDDSLAKTPLLWTLREQANINGVKFGCGVGACAACTVLVDGVATKSCQTGTDTVVGKDVTTVIAETDNAVMKAVQQAWYDLDVVQCGYCQPGQMLAASAYIADGKTPDDAGIDEAMSGNICRCGTYPRIRKAIYRAAEILKNKEVTGNWATPVKRADDDGLPIPNDARRFIDVRADGTALVRCSQFEMGQGILTTAAIIAADELDFPLEKISVVHTANSPLQYANTVLQNLTQATAGSTGTRVVLAHYRQAGADLRQAFLKAAAEKLSASTDDLSIEKGVITDAKSGNSVSFGELVGLLGDEIPTGATPKNPQDYKVIGAKNIHRVDSSAKITGTAQYVLDIAFDGMLTATVLHTPTFGGKLKNFDASEAENGTGIVKIMEVSTGVAIVADSFVNAYSALDKVKVEWDNSEAETRSSAQLLADHKTLVNDDSKAYVVETIGTKPTGGKTIEATYDVPYLAHTPMEPSNTVCRMREDGVLEVWVGFQVPEAVIEAAVKASGLSRDKIDVRLPYAGGGFGLHTIVDPPPVIEAIEIAKSLDWKYPIKVQYTRPEEIKTGYFRPMAVARIRGIIDDSNKLTAVQNRIATESVSDSQIPILRDRFIQNPCVDVQSLEGADELVYELDNYQLELATFQTKIRGNMMRSVATIMTEFSRESFIDEVAKEIGEDPMQYRIDRLKKNPRALAVLERAGKESNWDDNSDSNRAKGVAVSGSFASFSAQVVEVSKREDGSISIEKVTIVADCGRIINPDQVEAQIQGGLMFVLGSTLYGEIIIKDGGVSNTNLDTYQVSRMADQPEINIVIFDSEEPSGGVGEMVGPSFAPALANAIARLTGQRIRTMPFNKEIKFTPPRAKDKTGEAMNFNMVQNGPIYIQGDFVMMDSDNKPVKIPSGGAALCRCGASKNKPFCDGSHVAIGFDGTIPSSNKE